MFRKTAALFITFALSVSLLAGCGSVQKSLEKEVAQMEEKEAEEKANEEAQAEEVELLSGKHHAEIVMKDYGTIYVELDADTAPITVTNFVTLANSGFYDGLTFMRVVKDFMIQGGDPNKDCSGNAGYQIKGEFATNGVENNISHVRGTISMARGGYSMDSASCQFFICNADSEFLDGQYAGFGTVTDGMEVVDAITDDFAEWNGPIKDKDIQPVIETIKITD